MPAALVHPRVHAHAHREHGATLLSTLLILLALLILGASAAHTALDGERAARAERDHHIALQAAEAALVDAERDIEGGSAGGSDRASARTALFADDNAQGFVAGCGSATAPNAGLCSYLPVPGVPAWQDIDLAAEDSDRTVEYGRFTGARLPAGEGSLPARLPRYLIELMPHTSAGADASHRSGNLYRISAIGFGANPQTHVVLQTFYLKAPAGQGAP